MVKDAYEDYKRYLSDDTENMAETTFLETVKENDKLTPLKWEKKHWKDINCGMIVKVVQDEQIPADMIMINTSDPKGQCFVETKNLDGETNLKIK
jgi:P-type E1-E2 ATPase